MTLITENCDAFNYVVVAVLLSRFQLISASHKTMRIHSLLSPAGYLYHFRRFHVSGSRTSRVRICWKSMATRVRIFLVLSGYLITTQLLKEHDQTGGIALKTVYARRTLRIFPRPTCSWSSSRSRNWTILSGANMLTAFTYTVNYLPARSSCARTSVVPRSRRAVLPALAAHCSVVLPSRL